MTTNHISSLFAADETDLGRVTRGQSSYDALGTSLWEELVEGRAIALTAAHSPTHCVLEVARNTTACVRRPSDRRAFDHLRRILVGEAPKAVAYASKCGASTLAVSTGDALNMLGFKRGILYVPYLLVRAAHVASGSQLPACRVTFAGAPSRFHVGIERPDLELSRVLSTCECEVAGLMVQGYTNDAIAFQRGVSVRTVANQISSLFVKLGRSGRAQLLCALVEHEQTGRFEKPQMSNDSSSKSYRTSNFEPPSRSARDPGRLVGHAL